MASCTAIKTDSAKIDGLFADESKVSYSTKYTELKNNKTNSTKKWRQGMVSGNGLQGFVESGSPYSDTFIYQYMHFIMPNPNVVTARKSLTSLKRLSSILSTVRILLTMPAMTMFTVFIRAVS